MGIVALLRVHTEWVLVLFNQIDIGFLLLVQPLLPLEELVPHFLERIDINALLFCHGGDHVVPLAHLVE